MSCTLSTEFKPDSSGLIQTVTGRLSARLTAVEKETARVAGLIEGLGLARRIPD